MSSSRRPHLVLVGGVEGDLAELVVLLSHALHGATAQLDALQQGRLGGVSGHVSLWWGGAGCGGGTQTQNQWWENCNEFNKFTNNNNNNNNTTQ